MVIKKTEVAAFLKEIPNLHKHWGWFLAIGILLVAFGAVAIGHANWATEFTVIFLGFLLAGAGILQVLNGLYTYKWAGFSLSLLLGLFYIIAGAFCIFKPLQSAAGIGLLIAALLIVGGLFRMISAWNYRFDKWGWVVFNGLIAFLLGLLILGEWPASAVWVIGLFVGIDLVLMGCYWVKLALAAKKGPSK